jgi:hypothetical protein
MVSWGSVIPRPAQTTVLAATTLRRWIRSQRTSCAVTVSAGWPPVVRFLLDWAGGWPLGRMQQIQSPECNYWRTLPNMEAFGRSITIAQAGGMTSGKGPGGSLPVEASASIIRKGALDACSV